MMKTIHLILWVLLLQLVGYGMGHITQANLDPWYLSLAKSSLTPPGYLFGIVWGILYMMLAIVGWLLFQLDSGVSTMQLRTIFIAQLLLNWLWTPLFFYFNLIGAALICLTSIVLLTTYLGYLTFRQFNLVFWLLLPYWVWISFASYLNFVIWQLNV